MYIRTKDNIYEVTKDTKGTEFIVVGKNKTLLDYGTFVNSEADIINQSENLEELCDEIVVEYKDCIKKKTYLYNGTFEDLRKTHRYYYSYKFISFFKYYGAIWVQGKGLIYVAKMNENGELCLL